MVKPQGKLLVRGRDQLRALERVCPIKLTEMTQIELHARPRGTSKAPFITVGITAVIWWLEASAEIVF